MATITVEELTCGVQEGDSALDITIGGEGVIVKVGGIWISEDDANRIKRAIEAHQVAVRTLKGKPCTNSCNTTWVPDHLQSSVNAFPELRF